MPSVSRSIHARQRLRAARRPGPRHPRAGRGAEPRRPAPGAARRHRLRQDLHDGAGHRAREPADAGDGAQQDAGRPALPGVQALLPATTPSSTSSATTTTTSPRPTSRPPTRTSRRKRRSTTRSTGCGCRRRGRSSSGATSSSSPACRASTASARRRRTTACCCRSKRGQRIDRDQILRKLVEIQYERNDTEFGRGTFRVRGDIVEVVPSYEEHALRIELFGDEVDELAWFDPLTGKVHPAARQGRGLPEVALRHARATAPSRRSRSIKAELDVRTAASSSRRASCSRRSGCTSGRCSTSR